ncbi:MAG: nucleoside diphosphate kinase regulator [Terriglobia bacterium]
MIRLEERTVLITEADKEQLEALLDSVQNVHKRDEYYLQMLQEELDRAEVVAAGEIPPDVVTMNSQIRVRDLDAGKSFVCTLVFPRDADFARSRISVLAPIGTALLGYRVGDVIEWKVPAGTRRLRVEEVLYQPEAAGEKPDLGSVRDLPSAYHMSL